MSEPQGRFLTGSTMGHVVRMTATGAFGITFVFLVDAMNLFWVSQLGQPKLVAAIGFAYAVQFFSVSVAVGQTHRRGRARRTDQRLQPSRNGHDIPRRAAAARANLASKHASNKSSLSG